MMLYLPIKHIRGIVARSAVLFAVYRYGFTNDAGDSFPLSPFVRSRPILLPAAGRRRGQPTLDGCKVAKPPGAKATPRPYTKNPQSTPRLRSELDKTQVLYPPPQAFVAALRVLVRCPPRTIQNSGFVNVRTKAQEVGVKLTTLQTPRRPPTARRGGLPPCTRVARCATRCAAVVVGVSTR